MNNRSQEIEIRLTPEEWNRVQLALEGSRSEAITSRIEHSLRSLRREPNGTLSLIFTEYDGTVVTQALRLSLSDDVSGDASDDRELVALDPLPRAQAIQIPEPGSRCQAYRLTAGLPGDATNRCEQRATRQLQVRHGGTPMLLDLCTQHAKQNTHRRRPLYFLIDADLIGIARPL